MPRKMTTSSSTSKSTAKAPAKAAKHASEDGVGSQGQGGGRLQGARPSPPRPGRPDRGRRQGQVPGTTGLPFWPSSASCFSTSEANYIRSAETLKAQADSLALEHEPGDVQFDEEGGEGGTSNVDRELDLVLSAQARAAAAEIDRALDKIENGTYGLCEQCGQPIPDARLQALPQAALCVACKSGGLSSRR